ncbi:MAG: cell division ATP-binding protein FtsE, partial [bacterium]
MVRFQDVTKGYPNGVLALRRVSLRVDPGEFVFIVGPTGTGKSTLLRLLYRDESPSEGRVFVAGRDVGALPHRAVPALRRGLGVVFQDFKLLPSRTVYENIAFALRVIGTPPQEIRSRVIRALDLVGLAPRPDAMPGHLSGGEQQRVSIARAIVNDPPLLLADEPTGNLDSQSGGVVLDVLRELHADGTTVVVITHDREIAGGMPRQIAMKDG